MTHDERQRKLGELLAPHAVLIYNLLMANASEFEKEADDTPDGRACAGYAKFRRDLATEIFDLITGD